MSIESFFKGKRCDKCSEFGITCEEYGVFDFSDIAKSILPGNSIVKKDNKPVLKCFGSIDQCPVNIGESTETEMAKKLNERIVDLKPGKELSDFTAVIKELIL